MFDLPHELYPYQVEGVKFLAEHKEALLGDDMGTGKTIQTIVAMRILFQKGLIRSALLIVPPVLLKNWDEELEKWAEVLTHVTVVRGSFEERKLQWRQLAHVWIAGYSSIGSDIHLIDRKFDLIVIDEAQAIKNPDTDRSNAVKSLKKNWGWALSGTPIENKLGDLISIFDFVKPGLLWKFDEPQEARHKIEPYFLRRRKVDVLKDLPEKVRHEQWLTMGARQQSAYDRAQTEGIAKLKAMGEEVTLVNVLQLLQALKMICNIDQKSKESAKLEFLEQAVEDIIAQGDKALIFSQFDEVGASLIANHFKKFKPVLFSGKVSMNKRMTEKERFKEQEDCGLFVATTFTGGVGLTLTSANYVFHFDHWWNPAIVAQAEDRAHRIGQTKNVFVYHLWIRDSVEEKIYQILEKKRLLYAEVIDQLSNVEGTGLSEEELFSLFDLKSPRTRVGEAAKLSILDRVILKGGHSFEELCELLFAKLGYKAQKTKQSRDGGIDVVAFRANEVGHTEHVAIQCKCYAIGKPVGVEDARAFLGVLSANPKFSKGYLVTTTSFSPEVKGLAEQHGKLQLIDGKQLTGLIETYKLTV